MIDWHDFKLVAAIGMGLLMAMLLSTAHSWKARLTAVAAGIFFATLFTEPVIHWLGWEAGVWKYAIAGLLAMTGDRIARRAFIVIETLNLPRGKT